ncbi:MAG: N-acetylmuramoyl-L-alanine amidase [Rhodospirillales bacterium]|nr:N-acetylmuramoyl-L-alanine amidase [Rhodospirillales bacterium]
MTNTVPPMRERESPNHGPRRAGAAIDMLVLHYTGMDNAGIALDRLCDPAKQVGAHYAIEEDGTIWRLIPEDRRAWHAGLSFWAGETDINSRSIGIELVNPGHGPDYHSFPEAQMVALEALCRDIVSRHPIPPHRIVGHSDVAPGRKRDPGELFDWRRLAAAGISLWPEKIEPALPSNADFAELMRRFGYADSSVESIIAFQRHFRPANLTGIADDETKARLAALAKQAGLA